MKRILCLIVALLLCVLPLARAENPVIAAYDGGVVTYDDIAAAYETVLFYYTAEPPELKKYFVDDCIAARLTEAEAARRGLETLSGAEEAAVLRQADAAYDQDILSYAALLGGEEAGLRYLEEAGITRDYVRGVYLGEARRNAVKDVLTADVTVSEAEIVAGYEELLAYDAEYYGECPGDYRWDLAFGGFSVWVPEGYRMARAVLIPFGEEQQAAFDQLLYNAYESESAAAWSLFNRGINALYDELLPEAEAARARLDAGERFDDLCAAYGHNPERLGDIFSPEGFLISESSWESFSTAEIMALSEPGQVTGPVRCDSGYVLLEYLAPVPSGPVPYEEARADVAELVLAEKRDAAYLELVTRLMENAHIEYFLDAADV